MIVLLHDAKALSRGNFLPDHANDFVHDFLAEHAPDVRPASHLEVAVVQENHGSEDDEERDGGEQKTLNAQGPKSQENDCEEAEQEDESRQEPERDKKEDTEASAQKGSARRGQGEDKHGTEQDSIQ
ncbi:hypothetical protein [Prosthecobacter sp.]|uniref:hypothetical protein n=1 Tax=Prosthecobacter sp. TaxID=1965333 RepID=UPI003783F85A